MSTSILTRSRIEYDLDIETVPLPPRGLGRGSNPVTIISSFEVPCGREDLWLDTWEALGEIALEQHACSGFRIYRDRKDDSHFVIASEWADQSSFHRFARVTSLTWLERIMPGLCRVRETMTLQRMGVPVSPGEKISR